MLREKRYIRSRGMTLLRSSPAGRDRQTTRARPAAPTGKHSNATPISFCADQTTHPDHTDVSKNTAQAMGDGNRRPPKHTRARRLSRSSAGFVEVARGLLAPGEPWKALAHAPGRPANTITLHTLRPTSAASSPAPQSRCARTNSHPIAACAGSPSPDRPCGPLDTPRRAHSPATHCPAPGG